MSKAKTQVLKSPAPSRKEIKLPDALASVDTLTERHALNYNRLANTMAELEGRIASLKAEYLPLLRVQVADVRVSHEALNEAILDTAGEFTRPRTRVLHGFKVGFRKLEGKTVFADEERSIKLILQHMPGAQKALIATSHSIIKDAAAQLPAADLKRIGGEITDSVDQVVIQSATGDVVKLVDALIKDQK